MKKHQMTLLCLVAATLAFAGSARAATSFSDNDWVSLGSGMNGNVSALAVSGTNVYASDQSVGVIARQWDGSSWSDLGSETNNGMMSLVVWGSNVFAGGWNYLAKWDSSTWSELGSGLEAYPNSGTTPPYVEALAVLGTNLYVSGYFATAGGVVANGIAKWDGSAWSALGSAWSVYAAKIGYDSDPGFKTPLLAVGETNLYVTFRSLFQAPDASLWSSNIIAKWDGSTWSTLFSEVGGSVYAIAVSGTNLYAGGTFTSAGGVPANYVAKWNGSTWSALGSGVGSYVYALAVSGTNLYAGGSFTSAGGVPVNNIAKWDGSTWSALGSGVNDVVSTMVADEAGHLFVGGRFTMAGGKQANYIAQANLNGGTPTAGPITLTGVRVLSDGSFQCTFTNTPGVLFTVWTTTNLSTPCTNWTPVSAATEFSPGQFRFTDAQAKANVQRFYRIGAP